MHALVRGWRETDLSEADRALCSYTERLTLHQGDMGPEDLQVLRSHGFDDTAIHDATQIVGYFNYITRVADGLGVEPEDFIRLWGADDAPTAG